MGIVKAVGDYFRDAPATKPVDRYGILTPLLEAEDRIAATKTLYTLFSKSEYGQQLTAKAKLPNLPVDKAGQAYRDYLRSLPSREQSMERTKPFSTFLAALESIQTNLETIEDNFQSLFGMLDSEDVSAHVRASSLIIVGYLEKSDNFANWLAILSEHFSASARDIIPPFRTKEMLTKATDMAEFVSLNLHRGNGQSNTLLSEIKDMQKKGVDLPVNANGLWIDNVAHDTQYNPIEQELMTASLRSPLLMAVTYGQVRTQARIELLTNRKTWLTAKIALEEGKLRGLDPESPEGIKLQKAVYFYADLVSKFERQIERLRS